MITRARVKGMSCQHCVRAVCTSLAGVRGVTRAEVSIGALEVEHDGTVTVEALREAVAVAGYEIGEAVVDRRQLPITDVRG
jgi:copper chaperone CopZ